MGTTPIYGIRYPDPTTKANQLPQSFENLAIDTENALAAASIPPVSPASAYVAASAAARDAFFGVPGSAAEQLTLQRSGAQCIRSDLGWTETYWAGTGGGNTLGVAVAGWYPLPGSVFGLFRKTSQTLTTASTAYALTWETEVSDRFGLIASASASIVTVPAAGLWRLAPIVYLNSSSGTFTILARLNGVDYPATTARTAPASGIGGLLASNIDILAPAGATLQVVASSTTAAVNVVGGESSLSSKLGVTYLGPA